MSHPQPGLQGAAGQRRACEAGGERVGAHSLRGAFTFVNAAAWGQASAGARALLLPRAHAAWVVEAEMSRTVVDTRVHMRARARGAGRAVWRQVVCVSLNNVVYL